MKNLLGKPSWFDEIASEFAEIVSAFAEIVSRFASDARRRASWKASIYKTLADERALGGGEATLRWRRVLHRGPLLTLLHMLQDSVATFGRCRA